MEGFLGRRWGLGKEVLSKSPWRQAVSPFFRGRQRSAQDDLASVNQFNWLKVTILEESGTAVSLGIKP